MAKQLKMNSCKGIPGHINFKYKLPKYITKTSLTVAIYHIHLSYIQLQKDTHESDFIENELSRIMPNLQRNICKHFALVTDTDDKILTDLIIENEENEVSHVENDDSLIECLTEQQTQESSKDEGDNVASQCIWCGSPTESSYDKPLCQSCVAIPNRLEALECKINSLTDHNNSTHQIVNSPGPECLMKEKENPTSSKRSMTLQLT